MEVTKSVFAVFLKKSVVQVQQFMLQIWYGSTCVYSVQAVCRMYTLLSSIHKSWTGNSGLTVVEPFRTPWEHRVLCELCNKGNKPEAFYNSGS